MNAPPGAEKDGGAVSEQLGVESPDVEQALAGGYPQRVGWFRFYFEDHRLTGATIVAAHWRHPVEDYPMGGDRTNQIVAATSGLLPLGSYRDPDVAIEIFAGPDSSASNRSG
jgi:hypothetical protein